MEVIPYIALSIQYTMSNTSEAPRGAGALIAEVKNLIDIIDNSVTGPRMEYMATYDNFVTFKEDGEVFALSFEQMPDFIESWKTSMML